MIRFRSGRFLCALLGCLLVGAEPGHAVGKPNVVVIVADSLGWQALPWHGGDGKAPNLERMKDDGMELLRFYGCPEGAPARASLLTGRYHYRTGVAGDRFGENVMHGYEITLGEVFRDNGYVTACFGNWENGRNWPSNAQGQGFVRVEGEGTGDAVDLAKQAVSFFAADREQPFFCWLALPGGIGLPEVDAAAGHVLNGIDELEIADDTLVVFVSDTSPGGRSVNDAVKSEGRAIPELFGDAKSVHEGGVRIPFVVRWPGQIPPAAQSREISAAIDLLPTLVDLSGVTFVETLELDGISLAELLRTGGKPRRWPNRILFTSFTPPSFDTKNAAVAVRTGRWLAVREPRSRRGVEGGEAEEKNDWELYDMHADPYQRYDVAGEYWYLAGHLSADFSFWMKYTTENGLEAIPAEVGHDEWPTVELTSADAIFGEGAGTDQATLRWPIEVVAGGDYRISTEAPGDAEKGVAKVAIIDGEGKRVPEQEGKYALPAGRYEVQAAVIDGLVLQIER